MLVIYFNPATTITSGEWSNPPSEFLKMIDNNKKKSMANELGIGFSPLTENVYLGKKNKSKRMWVGQKKDITVGILRWAGGFVPQINPSTTARPCTYDQDLTSSQPCVNAVVICRNFTL